MSKATTEIFYSNIKNVKNKIFLNTYFNKKIYKILVNLDRTKRVVLLLIKIYRIFLHSFRYVGYLFILRNVRVLG